MSRRLTMKAAAAAFAFALSLLPAGAWGQSSPSDFTSAARYDALRRVTGTIAPDPDGTGPLRFAAVRNTYNEAGLLTKVEKGELAYWQSEAVAPENWTGFTVITQVDTAYDVMNRKAREAVSGGGATASVTEYGYDLAGRLKCIAVRMNPDAWATPLADKCVPGPVHAVNGPDRITRNSYDPRGQLLRTEKAVGTALRQDYARYSYSDNGKQTSVTDANNNRSEMTWDGLDRQKRWYFPSAATVGQPGYGGANPNDYEEYGYDSNANRISLRKRDGAVIGYQYDAANRLMTKAVPASASGAPGYSVYTAYDNRGLQTEARFGSSTGPGVSNTWNGFGEQSSTSTSMDGTLRTTAYGYDGDGNRIQVGGLAYGYDGLDRMTALSSSGVGLATFDYDSAGRRQSLRTIWAVPTTASVAQYDSVGRLNTLGLDLAGTAYDRSVSFGYNPASQIVSRATINDAYAWVPPYAVDRSYQANGLNQYAAVTDSGSAANAYAYDLNGNLTSNGTTNFVYDSENRLVKAYGAKNADLAYDPLGRLWQVSSVAGGTTRFYYDGDRLMLELDGAGNMLAAYAHGAGSDTPIIWWNFIGGYSRRNLHADQQGSIVAVTDGPGNGLYINSYDPWGVPGANNQGRFQYTGQTWLPELGMYYYKARIYYPALGRFLQTDPIGYQGGINLYGYVGNDPVNSLDPSGAARVCTQVTGQLSPACVAVDGNGDGNTKDNDLKPDQAARMGSAFHQFIADHRGADLSHKGASTGGDGSVSADQVNYARAVSQFVGAAFGHGWGNIELTVSSRDPAGAAENTPRVSGEAGVYWDMHINLKFMDLNTNPSSLARAMLHGIGHKLDYIAHGSEIYSVPDPRHQGIDAWARRTLMRTGLGGGGCPAIGGGLFGLISPDYPGC